MERGETERLLKGKSIGKFLVKFDPDNEGKYFMYDFFGAILLHVAVAKRQPAFMLFSPSTI